MWKGVSERGTYSGKEEIVVLRKGDGEWPWNGDKRSHERDAREADKRGQSRGEFVIGASFSYFDFLLSE